MGRMKKLLHKSLKPLAIFAFSVFVLSVPAYFLLVDWIWMKELDENNKLIAQRIENEFREQHLKNDQLAESITFWNELQPRSQIQFTNKPLKKDSVYTIKLQNPYTTQKSIDRFRALKTNIQINEQNYVLTIETNVEETEETVIYIAVLSLFFFLVLIVGFGLINRQVSKKVWTPFQDTLKKLKSFQLTNQSTIAFKKTDTLEFQELNNALDKLLKHSISSYKSQKEFTENASHELQTPLAIIKNKIDVLLQKEPLTERQFQLLEDINTTLTRVAHLNKNLLLLAKIENRQFEETQSFNSSEIIASSLEQLEGYCIEKHLSVQTKIEKDVILNGNKNLIEILFNNLIFNAIQHSHENGNISIALNKKQLKVSNSGIEKLNKETLFKRFAKTSAQSIGNGLGLSIVQQICISHSWAIHYEFSENEHIFKVQF